MRFLWKVCLLKESNTLAKPKMPVTNTKTEVSLLAKINFLS